MGIEFELKFRATEDVQESIRSQIPGEEKIYQMQTTYYDTPTGAFSQRHCTLRRRMENDVSICTLKAPAQGMGRREWEVECNAIEGALEKLCKLGAPEELIALAGEGLIPICGARFTRIAKTVAVGDGAAELALDKGILMGGGKEIALCEVEVEQKTCSQKDCMAFAQLLSARYGLVREEQSKFRRALALYKGE